MQHSDDTTMTSQLVISTWLVGWLRDVTYAPFKHTQKHVQYLHVMRLLLTSLYCGVHVSKEAENKKTTDGIGKLVDVHCIACQLHNTTCARFTNSLDFLTQNHFQLWAVLEWGSSWEQIGTVIMASNCYIHDCKLLFLSWEGLWYHCRNWQFCSDCRLLSLFREDLWHHCVVSLFRPNCRLSLISR